MSVRKRTMTTLALGLAVLAGAGLTPAGAAGPVPALSVAQASGLPEPDRQAVDELRARAADLLQDDASASAGAQSTLQNVSVERVSGTNRYATAAELSRFWSDALWADGWVGEKLVVVASGAVFADALSGGAVAAAYGGPVLLTEHDRLPGATAAALTRLNPDYVIVLGGTLAVSQTVEHQLAEYTSAPDRVVRVVGQDRYQVSAAAAALVGASSTAYVATGRNWPDGLAGGAAAGTQGAPLFVTRPDSVPGAVLTTLRTVTKPQRIVLLGGPLSVNDEVVAQLRSIAPVTRIGGENRYEVAANLAATLPANGGATMATGLNWPDAMAGSAFAGLVGDRVLLLRPTGVPGPTRVTVQSQGLGVVTVLGGPVALPDTVLDELRALQVEQP